MSGKLVLTSEIKFGTSVNSAEGTFRAIFVSLCLFVFKLGSTMGEKNKTKPMEKGINGRARNTTQPIRIIA